MQEGFHRRAETQLAADSHRKEFSGPYLKKMYK